MSKLVRHPKCKNCTGPNCYGDRYDGFCLQCHNAGVPELMEQIADRDRQLAELRALVPKLSEYHANYPDDMDIARCNYDCGVTNGMLRAALLPPTPKEADRGAKE